MFGSKRIQELEAQVRELQGKLIQETTEKADLVQQLDRANSRISDMEAQLTDFDLKRLKEEAESSRAEFEGLKELYARKNREFDDSREEKEQSFARDQALQRHNLENEIRDNRQANQDYVTSTVKSFGESYNYYLNQIKMLMDALGDVATRTGAALFSGENDDLKARFGHQMRDVLRSGADSLKGADGDLIIIGTMDEPEPEPEPVEPEPVEAEPEVAVEAVEVVAEPLPEVEEASEEVVDELKEEAEETLPKLDEE